MTLDDSSLETEPKFGHGEGNSGIWQLNSEFKSIAYDGEAVNQPYNAALLQLFRFYEILFRFIEIIIS